MSVDWLSHNRFCVATDAAVVEARKGGDPTGNGGTAPMLVHKSNSMHPDNPPSSVCVQ